MATKVAVFPRFLLPHSLFSAWTAFDSLLRLRRGEREKYVENWKNSRFFPRFLDPGDQKSIAIFFSIDARALLEKHSNAFPSLLLLPNEMQEILKLCFCSLIKTEGKTASTSKKRRHRNSRSKGAVILSDQAENNLASSDLFSLLGKGLHHSRGLFHGY